MSAQPHRSSDPYDEDAIERADPPAPSLTGSIKFKGTNTDKMWDDENAKRRDKKDHAASAQPKEKKPLAARYHRKACDAGHDPSTSNTNLPSNAPQSSGQAPSSDQSASASPAQTSTSRQTHSRYSQHPEPPRHGGPLTGITREWREARIRRGR